MNMNRVVLDVYDHGFVEETEDRWRKVEKEKTPIALENKSDDPLTFSEFYIAKSTSIKVPEVNERFDYLKVSHPYTVQTYPLAIGAKGLMQATSDSAKYWSPILELDWKAIFEPGTILNHISFKDLWFVMDHNKIESASCNEHNKKLIRHDHP